MSIRVMSQIWEIDLPPTEKLVLLVIADHADDEGCNAYPSVRRVARRASMSERSVQRIIRRLCDDGFLAVEENMGGGLDYRSDRRPNRYRICGVTEVSPRSGHGVTPEVLRGDIGALRGDSGVADGVTVVSPNTSIEPSIGTVLEEASRLCEMLADSWVSAGGGHVRRPKVTDDWVLQMDRLMRLDRRSAAEVEEVIRFVEQSEFWSVNIGSPAKLRKHFDRLVMEKRRGSKGRFGGIMEFLGEGE